MLINEWSRQEKNDYHLVSVDRVLFDIIANYNIEYGIE